jgi:hypothetical protein
VAYNSESAEIYMDRRSFSRQFWQNFFKFLNQFVGTLSGFKVWIEKVEDAYPPSFMNADGDADGDADVRPQNFTSTLTRRIFDRLRENFEKIARWLRQSMRDDFDNNLT